eukprot:342285_1
MSQATKLTYIIILFIGSLKYCIAVANIITSFKIFIFPLVLLQFGTMGFAILRYTFQFRASFADPLPMALGNYYSVCFKLINEVRIMCVPLHHTPG